MLSITPTHARVQKQAGTRVGRYLEDFKYNIDRPLTAILTLNTIAHTVGAIGVGAQAVAIWEDANPWITRFIVPATMTIAILIFSEIVPKTIGATYWQRLMSFTVLSLRLLTQVLAPFVWISQYVTRRFKGNGSQSIMTRTEFLTTVEIGAQDGVLDSEEGEMISNVLHSGETEAKAVMTPRTVVEVASESWKLSDYYKTAKSIPFSRIPVYTDSMDHITGYVLKSDLLCALIDNGTDQTIGTHRREIVAVDESFAIIELFKELRKRQEQIAVVIDDFGGMTGIVTMEDILETMLGLEIVDETDHTVDMRELARRRIDQRTKPLAVLKDEKDNAGDETINSDTDGSSSAARSL